MTALWIVIATPAIAVLAGFLYQSVGKWKDRRRFPPLGRIVRAGSQTFHVIECGSGPSVVLEAGIASTSLAWSTIQPELSRMAHTIAYDRTGFGWSSVPRHPRTLENAVIDLHAMLGAAGTPAPYIVVGHSYGGLIVRGFAARYPHLVAGIVLVDPVDTRDWSPLSEAQRRRLAFGVKLSRRGALLARLGLVRFALVLLLSGNRRLPQLIARWSAGRGSSVTERLTGEVRKLPEKYWPIVRMHWSNEKCFRTMAQYLERLPENAAAASALGWPSHVPVVVITAAGTRPELPDNIVHRVAAASGHWIQLDQPELVRSAIRDVLARSPITSQSAGR